jgi:predicted nucleic acid-binding protein
MSRAFFDTNVLIYAFSTDDHRSPRALELLHHGGVISVQCLNEFASVARRKLNLSWSRVRIALRTIEELCEPIVPLTRELHHDGLVLAEERQLSVYDGMIVAAARASGCDVLWSEDMHHGLVIDGVLTIRNPFAD